MAPGLAGSKELSAFADQFILSDLHEIVKSFLGKKLENFRNPSVGEGHRPSRIVTKREVVELISASCQIGHPECIFVTTQARRISGGSMTLPYNDYCSNEPGAPNGVTITARASGSYCPRVLARKKEGTDESVPSDFMQLPPQ